MLKTIIIFFLITAGFESCFAQHAMLDVLSYDFAISVTDESDRIEMQENLVFIWKDQTKEPIFDLQNSQKNGKGMVIQSIRDHAGTKIDFTHQHDLVTLKNLKPGKADTIQLIISYSGIPSDGLVIGKNKFGERTFFGDNWPDRGHLWLFCNDHPADKAFVKWNVTAPAAYQVVANGLFTDKKNTDRLTTWQFSAAHPLPVKVMVVGIAPFFECFPEKAASGIDVCSFVYRPDSLKGCRDFEQTATILNYLTSKVGEFPFEKLDHVESTTRFGGMENAGCIFYDENAIRGSGRINALIAHETAHQWFGNAVTESDWPHLWLSEGFATFFTNCYLEDQEGLQVAVSQFQKDRKTIIAFNHSYHHPVVDTFAGKLTDLLNANSYQRGSWFLRMLRIELGDELFFKGIRLYYDRFRDKNASTSDFRQVMEEVGMRDLSWFFHQWLYESEIPVLHIDLISESTKCTLKIEQKNAYVFKLNVPVKLFFEDGSSEIILLATDKKTLTYRNDFHSKVVSFELDPDTQLLAEEK